MGALASGRWPGLLGLTGLPTAQADLREEVGGFPWWAAGPSRGHQLPVPPATAPPPTPPAWCWLLESAGRACVLVHSALVSRGLSKINFEISLPLALAGVQTALAPGRSGSFPAVQLLASLGPLPSPRLQLCLPSALPSPHQAWSQALGLLPRAHPSLPARAWLLKGRLRNLGTCSGKDAACPPSLQHTGLSEFLLVPWEKTSATRIVKITP